MNRQQYDEFRSEIRTLKRSNRGFWIIAALCLGLAASQWWRAEHYSRLNVELQTTITELRQQYQPIADVVAQMQNTVEAYPIAINGLGYALRAEQARAGNFESRANNRQEKLDNCRRYISHMRYTLGKKDERLRQKGNLVEQLQSENWTGNVKLKSKGD